MFWIKVVFVFSLALTAVSSRSGILGGITFLSGDDLKEAETVLNTSLNTLGRDPEGPDYKLGKIISATRQVVSGSKYVYEAELIQGEKTKTCNVEIWSQPWLPNGIQVTFNCPDGKVVKKHSA